MLTVRAARADDVDPIVKLERYCFPPEIAFGRSRWHYLLTQARGRTLLVLDDKEQLMGYLSLLEHRGWDRLVVQALAIRWTVRRLGWARRLLEQVIREGREGGWGAIRLEVGENNEAAQALYQGLGFRLQQTLPDYYGYGQHARRLVLPLREDDISGRSPRRKSDAAGARG